MQADYSLDRVQRWMLEVVTQPGSTSDALHSKPAQREIPASQLDRVVLPSQALSPEERVGIYHGMYMLRMVEALEFDYPGVAHLLGHHRFHHLVDGYVRRFPSRSYTLNRLGDHLAEYIAECDRLPHRRFACDLAKLELAITDAFDAAQARSLSAEEIAAVPADTWADARLGMIPAMKLLSLDYPVDDYLQSMKRAETRPPMRKDARWMIVYRRDLGVMQAPLARRSWELLARLNGGATLGDAVEDVSRRFRPRLTETEIFTWFRTWTSWGLFASVESTRTD